MRKIGKYQLFAALKKGETGATYRAIDTDTNQIVLVKTYARSADDNGASAATRFAQEAKVYARIQHANVVKLLEYGSAEPFDYIALEFIEGQTLREVLQRAGQNRGLPVEIAVMIFTGVLQGVQEIHRHDIIHRDLKPENILISSDGQVKICDFDLATAGATLMPAEGITGSPGYVSPEVVLGEEISFASDIFALGILLYELLAGTRPFHAETAAGELNGIVRMGHLPVRSINREVPEAFDALLDKMLAKKPGARFKSVVEIQAWLDGRFNPSTAATRARRLQAYLRAPEQFAPAPLVPRPTANAAGPEKKRRYVPAFSAVGILALLVLVLRWLGENPVAPDRSASLALPPDTGAVELAPAMDGAREPGTNRKMGPAATQSQPVTATQKDTARGDQPAGEAAQQPRILHKTLYLKSNPWAYVFLDSDSLGITPLAKDLVLSAGLHRITLKNPEFPALHFPVQIGAQTADTLNFSLWQRVAQVHIVVNPWARFFINGEARADIEGEKRFILLPGKYELRFEHPELGTKSESIYLVEGETRQLEINMF